MSEYQVIARKWRPQRFGDVVGQQHVVQTLKNAIINERTAHAYLFVGPRGVGKTTLARIFAKAMNCLNPQDGEPCCECESCRGISEERSLDVMEVDAASRNTTGDMRDLTADVQTQPLGRYKIYIIDEVHMLSKQAWNVLLKTVEEPPSHVKFIFATTEVHQVLPTIISRCQRFDLLPIQTRLIAERLRLICDTEKVAINDAAIGAIARAAEGGMRDAQSLLDQMIAFFSQGDGSSITGEQVLSLFGLTDRQDLDAILVAMLSNNPGEVVSIIAKLARKGKNLETLFDDLLEAVRAVQLCALMPDPQDLINESEEAIARYKELASKVRPDTVQILLEGIAPVGRDLHDALNKQVYLETIILKAMREAHAVRINDILQRLNQLRAVGELKFLEQVPPVQPVPMAPVPPLNPTPIQSVAPTPTPTPTPTLTPTPAPAVPVASTPGSAPVPVVSETVATPAEATLSKPDPVVQPAEKKQLLATTRPLGSENSSPAPSVPSATVPEADASASSSVATMPTPEATPESTLGKTLPSNESPDSAKSEAIPVTPAPTVMPAEATENSGISTSEASSQVSLCPTTAEEDKDSDSDQDDQSTESETPPDDPSEPDHRVRVSVLATEPDALEKAAKDPFIKQVIDLFDGEVVDVHR